MRRRLPARNNKQETRLDGAETERVLPIRSPRHDGPDCVLRLPLAPPFAGAGRSRLASRGTSDHRIRVILSLPALWSKSFRRLGSA